MATKDIERDYRMGGKITLNLEKIVLDHELESIILVFGLSFK